MVDFRLQPSERALREEVRVWLHQTLGPNWVGEDADVVDQDWDTARWFNRKLAERGWMAPAWPKEHGGQSWSHVQQLLLTEQLVYHRAPAGARLFGPNMVGPTLILHGTPEQQRQHLPPILRGETVWCQGFSEPGAGSDLAALQCRAVRDGDDYIINGQKIWTSNAQHADKMLLLARTDFDAPKHKGISAFIVDMKSPGISVVPIENLAYRHDFNTVFFEDVRVPRENLIGGENNGWYVAATTLDFERSNIAAISGARRTIQDLICWAKTPTPGGRPWDRPEVRSKLAELYVEGEVGRLIAYRTAWLQSRGEVPNYEASIGKVWMAQLGIRVANAGVNLMGLYGQLSPGSPWAKLYGRVQTAYLLSVSGPIAGGTAEIQKNIIATRGLGLPR